MMQSLTAIDASAIMSESPTSKANMMMICTKVCDVKGDKIGAARVQRNGQYGQRISVNWPLSSSNSGHLKRVLQAGALMRRQDVESFNPPAVRQGLSCGMEA